MKRTILLAMLSLAANGVCLIALAQDAAPEKPADAEAAAPAATPALPASIEALTERVRKSVVVVTSGSRDGSRDGLGSGFIVSADGLIATNYHVVREGRGVRVHLADGRGFDVTAIHAFDRQLDLAILRIDAQDLPALELGDVERVKQGQSVVALGNPAGLKNSVVAGVVSAVREMEGRQMIQLAIPIEPGNSGGPLVDLEGRVLGLLTMKSLVTPNLGFAVSINLLKPLLDKPNPIPMSRWMTIGALDEHEWKPLLGARWRQRAGRVTVEGPGIGFGGRSMCLCQSDVPKLPLELEVTVRLNNESGAAGLAFSSDGGVRHFGFYPSNGNLRLTRFDGPDVTSWTILYDKPSRHYVSGDWNTLRVRLAEGKVTCFVNGEQLLELADSGLADGKVGLVKFRDTAAQFKNFRVGSELPAVSVPPEDIARIEKLVADLPADGPLDEKLVESLADDPARSARVLRERAALLDRRADQLRQLAQTAHERRVIDDLIQALDAGDEKVDLFRASLLVARLDNEEVDVEAYCGDLDRMAKEVAGVLPDEPTDEAKLAALRKYLFEENGFHGSRGDYYNRANSYVNEVLDDREGLPITLSVVYMELARRIGLKVEGVGLPGHFVVQYVPAEGERQLIDVYEAAAPVSREEAGRRVKEATERELTDDDLRPATARAIVVRMLQNLLGLSTSEPRATHRYLNAILALEPTSAPHHWLRAIVRYGLDDHPGASVDVEWLVEHKPEGIDMARVLQLQQALAQAGEANE